jgi:hypothetical protein
MMVESGFGRALVVTRKTVAGEREQHHRLAVGRRADAFSDLVPIKAGKADIDDGHFWILGLEQFEPADAVFSLDDVVAGVLEDQAEHLARVAIVLDQEHAFGRRCLGRRREIGGC